jgi:Fe2+ or Zn2+ uptake regulation protein
MKTVDCPTCHGAKFVTVTVSQYGTQGVEFVDIMCVVCNGTGKVVEAQADAIAAHLADWCQCDDAEREHVKFYGDGEHPDCHKHHYRHEPGCGKIVQIG